MIHILNPQMQSSLRYFLYRRRFFLTYIFIGVLSLLLEFTIRRLGMEFFNLPVSVAVGIGVATGIFLAFWVNARFNFKIPPSRNKIAFLFFVLISLGSLGCNFFLRAQLSKWNLGYEMGRLISSIVLFCFAYLLHRRFTFRNFKEVGIAVYVNTAEDIRLIRQKVGEFPSFIHVDIVDETFNPNCTLPATMRMEVVRAYWEKKSIHAHVMSSEPRRWLKDVLLFCDVAIFHIEGVKDLPQIIEEVKQAGKKAGVAMCYSTPTEDILPYLGHVDIILLLAIAQPGYSGQVFQMEVLDKIKELNAMAERQNFEICIDGGVNERNISLLPVEKVVTGSSVLNHMDPVRQIMRLQTSSNYESD